jgi:hypothetical protein
MKLFARMALLGATALVALSPPSVIKPAAAIEATVVKSSASPQLATRADHPSAFKRKHPKKKSSKKK